MGEFALQVEKIFMNCCRFPLLLLVLVVFCSVKNSLFATPLAHTEVGESEQQSVENNLEGKNSVVESASVIPIAVVVSAQSEQQKPSHPAVNAIDGDPATRWCGDGPDMPNWFQLELQKAVTISGVELAWEIQSDWMQYTIETSPDGQRWTVSTDASQNTQAGVRRERCDAQAVRFLRVKVLRQQRGMWPSLREIRLFDGDGNLLPLNVEHSTQIALEVDTARLQTGGNSVPRTHRLTPAEENELLAGVAVPEGFAVTLFAPWQMANYPTYLAAAPNGDLYVSSDGNGSLGRQPHRGRVLRLRDIDNDGRADEVTEFIPDIDSPRGIVWDHDRLYVLHPPHIDAFFDADHDGVAESSQRLISNIAFGFDKRPADHTTNGLEMGVDGWLYVACGDFGFMEATGTDGRTLQMRGGGVVRFRPNGSGLETYSDGTRNIYGIAVSPMLDLFARDNTNDGGGWNVRLHHLSGLEDHGYPRLFQNFAEEIVKPLADYGGGSGCGACFIDEPGIPPAWNKRAYTCDWGRGASFRHPVKRQGAGFVENGEPEEFFKMPRPTDIDVDGRSAVYQAAWKGPATFKWDGPAHGFIARATPTSHVPTTPPEFPVVHDIDLVDIVKHSASHVRRLAAQRMLLRRSFSEEMKNALLEVVQDRSLPLENRVVALYAISQRGLRSQASHDILEILTPNISNDDPILPMLIRSCGDFGIDLKTAGTRGPVPADLLERWLSSTDPRSILESIIATVRQDAVEVTESIAVHLASPDPLIVHTAYRGLVKLNAYDVALQTFDNEDQMVCRGAALALMRMHQPEVVSAIIDRLRVVHEPERRTLMIEVLARLAQREAKWKGDSWSTRPDTRGPYYQPELWEETPKILTVLNGLLDAPETSGAEAAGIVAALGRNRVRNDRGLAVLLNLAQTNSTLQASLIQQLMQQDDLPTEAIPILTAAVKEPAVSPESLLGIISLLLRSNNPDVFPSVLDAIVTLQRCPAARQQQKLARVALLASPVLQNHVGLLSERLRAEASGPGGEWYAACLLTIASDRKSKQEPRDRSLHALDQAWQQVAGRHAIIQAVFWTKLPIMNDRLLAASNDPDKRIQQLAKSTMKRLGIQQAGEDTTQRIEDLPLVDAVVAVNSYTRGSIALGEVIFTHAQCVNCHTVSEDAPAKGPYLGSIAMIYRRPQLAEAILMPNKTIAQGFKTNLLLLKSGITVTGFVTKESADGIMLRDANGKEQSIAFDEIDERMTLPTSVMPAGLINRFTVHEVSSLIDYIESLAVKKSK
jgi:putative membrane-bound dehydrogenase-like protein